MYRNRGLLLPLLLIAIGAIVLLANVGVISSDALLRLGDLWPLLLVIVGLQLILNHTLPRQQATLIGLGATAVIVIAAVAYATLAPATTFGTRQANVSDRLGGLTAATLDLGYSGAVVDIRGGTDLGDSLYQAHVEYPGSDDPPTISLDHESGTLAIGEHSSFSPLRLFGAARRHVAITLTDRIPWTIKISGGTANAHLDLRRLQLAKIEISGGASRLDAQLPSPKGTVVIDLSGSVSNLTLRAPAGAQWRVAVSGGVSGLRINGSYYAAIGGGVPAGRPREGAPAGPLLNQGHRGAPPRRIPARPEEGRGAHRWGGAVPAARRRPMLAAAPTASSPTSVAFPATC